MSPDKQVVNDALSWLDYMLSRRDAWYKCAAANKKTSGDWQGKEIRPCLSR